MKTIVNGLIAAAGLLMTLNANAAIFDLGTITAGTVTVVDSNFSDPIEGIEGIFGDIYNFTVDSEFNFTSSVAAFGGSVDLFTFLGTDVIDFTDSKSFIALMQMVRI